MTWGEDGGCGVRTGDTPSHPGQVSGSAPGWLDLPTYPTTSPGTPGNGVQAREHPGTPAAGLVRPRLAGFVPGRTMTCIKPPRLRSGAPRSPAARPGACGGAGHRHPRIITPPADPILLASSLPAGFGGGELRTKYSFD